MIILKINIFWDFTVPPHLNEVVDHALIKVLSSEMGVSRRGLHLKDAVLNRQDGDVKGAATEIKDEHVALACHLLVETVRDGSRGRFVDDTEYVQTGDGSGVLGRLTLGVVEVCRDCDDSVGHGLRKKK